MCMPKAPKDNSAQIAAQQEAARQAKIAEGQQAIDAGFTGFNDDFYNQYSQDYLGYYQPQLTDQYNDARKRLTLQLAKTGNLTSSAGANQLADLQKYYDTQNTGITNKSMEAVNALRGNVDQRKSQLYADNRAAADPGSAGSAAAAAAQALQPSLPSSPLANTFNDFFNNLGNAAAVYNVNQGYGQSGVQNFGGGNKSSYQVYN